MSLLSSSRVTRKLGASFKHSPARVSPRHIIGAGTDSGATGKFRVGLGESIEIRHRQGHPFYIYAALDRIENPARRRFGGGNGAPGKKSPLKSRGSLKLVPVGDGLIVETPGGATMCPLPTAMSAEASPIIKTV